MPAGGTALPEAVAGEGEAMRFWFVALLLLATASPAAAQDDIDCSNQMAQQVMNICAARDYEAADVELNAVWKEARTAAKDLDAELSEDLKGAEKALLAGQRGWIAYRDGQCELAGFEARGGSMEPMLVSGCLADLTRKRTKELREFIGGGEAQ
jgi:uncharacterized protein YecT (DUF1311 family)